MIDYIVEESCAALNFPAWGEAATVLDIVANSSTEVCDTASEIIESLVSDCEPVTDYDINDYIRVYLSDELEEKGYISVCYDGISYFTKAD